MDVETESSNPMQERRDSSTNKKKDSIVGLEFTNGLTMYCHRSTLVNAGGYFAAYFGGNGIPAIPEYVDERGRNIYFVEGDGELFANYILRFILRRIPGKLPPFSKDPELWRALRSEALSYVLDDLLEFLKVTHSCPYTKGIDKGVLHWLGTGKGKHKYRNPHSIGAVNVSVGGLQDSTYEQRSELFDSIDGVGVDPRVYTKESREALVQYRPPVIGCLNEENERYDFSSLHPCYSLWCHLSLYQFPTVIDLVTVKLRLSAFSLRQDRHGMTDFNLEGSEDGELWTVLHEARNDRHIVQAQELNDKWSNDLGRCKTRDEKVAITLEFAERERRHTWEILPGISNAFYRYFRIIGSGSDYERHEDSSSCLHGVGLELYGDVHED